MVEPTNSVGVAPEAASTSTAMAPNQSRGQAQAARDDDDAVVAARHKNLQHPRPRRGWKLVRNVVLPRTDATNPKSSFGLNLIKSSQQATSPHTVVKETPASAHGNAESSARKDDIVVAVNGHVVFNVDTMEVCDKNVFRYVIRLMKQTREGNPLRLDVLRPCGDDNAHGEALEDGMDGNDSISTPEISDDSLVTGPAVAGPKPGSTGADLTAKEDAQNQTTIEPKTQQQQKQLQQHNKVRSSFIVQVPPATKVGDTIRVRIPSTSGEASPKVVGITCPAWLGYADTRKRYLRLVLSDEKAPPIEGATPMDYIAASAARPARHRSSANFLTLSPSKNRRKRRQFIPSPSIHRYAGSNAKSGGGYTKYDEEADDDDDYAAAAGMAGMDIQWEDYQHGQSRVGRQYQVTAFPRALNMPTAMGDAAAGPTRSRGSHRELEDWSNEPPLGYDAVWDPQKAADAIGKGEDIDGFLDSLPTYEKAAGMEALHLSNYIVAGAKAIMDKKDRKDPTSLDVHGAPLTKEQAERFRSLVKSTSKSFFDIAASLGISVISAMIHYYRVYKQTDEYKILKERLSTEMDLCWMCDDGGDLLMCDSCDRGYHPDCLDPPLSVIPEGEWKCPLCAKKEDRRRRSSISSASSTSAKPANKCRVAGCTRFKQYNRDGMCIYHYKQSSDAGVDADADDSSIATLDSSVATNSSVTNRHKGHKHCRIAGCSKYKQHQCEGFCKNHYKEEMDKRAALENQKKISSPKPNNKCRIEGCNKFKQYGFDGMCRAHHNDANSEEVLNVVLDAEESSAVSTKPKSKCRIEGCNKFKQYGFDGMCRAHYNDANSDKELSPSDAPPTLKYSDSSNKKRSMTATGTRRSPRTSPKSSNADESRIIDMTALSDDSEEETWECIRCNESVPVDRFRCTACKAWKDGKRPTKGSPGGNESA